MNGYVCFYRQRRAEIYASTLLEAKRRAVQHFKVSKKHEHEVAVMLAEKDGKPVVHVAAD